VEAELPTGEARIAAGEPAVIQYWHSEQPPQRIVDLMATFHACNPDLRHVVFSESTAEAFIAEHLSAREAAAFRACAQPTSQADYLRYCAAYAMGGLCIDADVRCVGDVRPLIEAPRRGILFGQRDPLPGPLPGFPPWPHTVGPYETLINGIFAFARPRDPLLGLAVEVATANIENRLADGPVGVWLATGPGVFTSFYLLHRLGSIDAFVGYAAGTVLEPTASLFCEVVGEYASVERALRGVDMAAVEDVGRWAEHVGIPRSSDRAAHWSRPEGSIFR
jgi:Glycosyltransferase sugar-binding region containing DXD motif